MSRQGGRSCSFMLEEKTSFRPYIEVQVIVTISGIDCSGKSTQLECLQSRLAEHGVEATPFWFRPGYSDELDALRASVRKFRPQLLPRAEGTQAQARERAFEKPHVRASWLIMAIADICLQYGLKLRAKRMAGKTVLCDRYLFDARLDLELRFPEMRLTIERTFRWVERFMPRPDHAFLLMLPYDEMNARMATKDEPFPDPESTRKARYDRYLVGGANAGMVVLDADRDRDAVADDVWELVCASLK